MNISKFKHAELLSIVLVTGTLICLALVFSHGFVWPDEIYQSMEPAFEMVTGRGFLTWEFEERARSILYPAILSVWMRLVFLFTDEPAFLFHATRAILGGGYLYAVCTIYRAFASGVIGDLDYRGRGAALAIFLFGFVLFPLNYYFGFRTLSESFSTILAIPAILLALDRRATGNVMRHFVSGLLLGIAFGVRFQIALFLVGFVPVLVWQLWKTENHTKSVPGFVAGIVGGFLIYALSDFLYYGVPFISAWNYIDFNVFQRKGESWGISPFYYYFQEYYRYFGLLLVFLLPGLVAHFHKMRPLIIGLASFILLHSVFAHKELRFVYFTFPWLAYFICVGVFVAFDFLQARRRWAGFVFLFICAAGFLEQYSVDFRKKIPWNLNRENLQAFFDASRADFHGNIMIGMSETFSWGGGYVYMGRQYRYNIHFHDIQNKNPTTVRTLLKQKQVKYLLIRDADSGQYCTNYKFCARVLETGRYVWLATDSANPN